MAQPGLPFPDPTGGLEAVEHRHLAIHEHQPVVAAFQGDDGVLAIGGHFGGVAQPGEHGHGHFAVHRVVLHHQNDAAAGLHPLLDGMAGDQFGREVRFGVGRQYQTQDGLELGLAQGPGKVGGKAGLLGLLGLAAGAHVAEQHPRQVTQQGVRLQGPGGLEGVILPGGQGQHRQVEGLARGQGQVQSGGHFRGQADGCHLHAQAQHFGFQGAETGDGSAGQQDPAAGKVLGHRRAGRPLGHRQRHGEPEAAALAGFALHPHGPAQQGHQPAGNGQPQAGALEAPGGGSLDLGEGLENPLPVLGRNADAGVADFEAQVGDIVPMGHQVDLDHHLAAEGELHRVAHQVHEDLPQPAGIPFHPARHLTGQDGAEVEVLVPGGEGDRFQGVLHHAPQVEGDPVHLHPARLDFGKVQDVVDDAQQRVGGALDDFGEFPLLALQGGFQQQARHADDAVHGGADFVAHGGQEFAFGLVGGFRPDHGGAQVLGALPDHFLQLFPVPGQFQLPELDLPQHGVEVGHQQAQFVLAPGGHPQGIVMEPGDVPGGGGQFHERPGHPPLEPLGDHQGHGEGQQGDGGGDGRGPGELRIEAGNGGPELQGAHPLALEAHGPDDDQPALGEGQAVRPGSRGGVRKGRPRLAVGGQKGAAFGEEKGGFDVVIAFQGPHGADGQVGVLEGECRRAAGLHQIGHEVQFAHQGSAVAQHFVAHQGHRSQEQGHSHGRHDNDPDLGADGGDGFQRHCSPRV